MGIMKQVTDLQYTHHQICEKIYQAIDVIKEFKIEQRRTIKAMEAANDNDIELDNAHRLYNDMDQLQDRFYSMIDELEKEEPYCHWQE